MRILVVNHTGLRSGAEVSLLDLLANLPDGTTAAVAAPPGDLAGAVGELGIELHQIPGTALSLRVDPRHTPREVARMARSLATVRTIARRVGPDVLHANSMRAGLIASAVPRRVPIVVQAHDALPPSRAADLTRRVVRGRAGMVVANSDHTARSVMRGGGRACPVRTVYYAIDSDRFDSARADGARVRRELDLDPRAPTVGVIGQITPWKGQDVAIEAVASLTGEVPSIRLLLAGTPKFVSGATRYDNLAYRRELEALVRRLGAQRAVTFLGERQDVPDLLASLDLLLMPSWEEPFGRIAVEAMAIGTPVLATAVGGPPEFIEDGRSGVLLPPREPEAWARAIRDLLADPDQRERISAEGRSVAARFTKEAYVAGMLAAYREAAAR